MIVTQGRFGRCAALLAASVLVAAASTTWAAAVLDGRTFVVETGERGKPKAETDEISFREGRFRSKACDPYGFGSALYEAATKDGATSFTAETASAKEGRIRWQGAVRGETLEGTYVWSKPGQADIAYWFKGKVK
jgi:hypothetical protein